MFYLEDLILVISVFPQPFPWKAFPQAFSKNCLTENLFKKGLTENPRNI